MFAKHVLSNLDFDESQELDESLDMRKTVCPGAGPRQCGVTANATLCDAVAMRNMKLRFQCVLWDLRCKLISGEAV